MADNYAAQDEKPYSLRAELELLRSQLELERSSFLSTWREAGDYILPRRPRFATTDANRGERKNQKIIDSTATLAARTLRSGMMSGVTSPARPWFSLTTPDPVLSESAAVKEWCYIVGQRMTTIFLKSNLYNVLPIVYGDIGTFATAAMMMEEDFEDVVRFYAFSIGSYMIANDEKLRVNVFFRDFRMTVRQIVSKFGYDHITKKINWKCISPAVKAMWDNKQFENWVDVRHCIRPNPNYDPKKAHSKFKKFQSVYYEAGNYSSGQNMAGLDDFVLSEKGYDYFPVLCPRWEVTAEDVYGTSCPAVDTIGDIKQLQIGERRKMQAIDKKINPPMVAPTSMRNQKTSILPGDVSYADERDGQKGFRAAHEVNISITELQGSQRECQERIKRGFYEDLFLMLSDSDRRQITAREVQERHEEKLLALGPVLEQLNQDLLDPLIDNTFQIMLRQDGLIPKPPKELQGQPLKVEYLSIMAQAQKLIGIEGVERFAAFAQGVVQAHPESGDKIDTDHMLEVYGDMTSIAPGIIRTDDEVQQIRDQRQKAQQAQAQMEAMQQGAQTAQTLSQTDMSGDNALNRLLETAKAGQLEPTR